MNGCQCNDAEHHLCRRTHDGEKRSPGHLLNLVHVVGKLGEVLAALLLMILLMGLVQQARAISRRRALFIRRTARPWKKVSAIRQRTTASQVSRRRMIRMVKARRSPSSSPWVI